MRINGTIYFTEKFRWDRKDGWHRDTPPDGRLFDAKGKLSEAKEEDLPVHYVHGRFMKTFGYLRAKDVKDIAFRASNPKYNNHALKDCSMYVSFKGPIEFIEDRDGFKCGDYKTYSVIVDGWDIIHYLRAVEKHDKKFDKEKLRAVQKAVQDHLHEYLKYNADEHEAQFLNDKIIDQLFDQDSEVLK